MERDRTGTILAGVVILHLAVTLLHGRAHSSAGVVLPPAAFAFVIAVVVVAPIAGLGLTVRSPRAGGLLIGLAMAASLVFGVVNHFLLPGADHVGHVVGPSRTLFGVTAVLLALTEAAGTVLGLARARPLADEP
jgi:hypothetical protein